MDKRARVVFWGVFFACLVALIVAAGPGHSGLAPRADLAADSDGDKVYEMLEAQLGAARADERLPVIVRLRADATAERVAELERAVGDFAVERRFSIIDAFSARLTPGQIARLSRERGVWQLEPDLQFVAASAQAQESFGVAKARADAPGLDGDADGNPNAYTKNDLVAAVLDSGIDAGHADLDEGKVLAFQDFIGFRSQPYDDSLTGHGTHVAGILAGDGDADGRYRGVAPGAGLVVAKVLDKDDTAGSTEVIAALEWVIGNRALYGIEVVNLSIGFGSACSDGSDGVSASVNAAASAGLVVTVAAGNFGAGTCTIGAPAAAAGALTVGAMADLGSGGFKLWSKSSRGLTADGRIKPDVVGPGIEIIAPAAGSGSGYITKNGSSMASPFVAGLALLMREANPSLTAQAVKDAIIGTAHDWGRAGNGLTFGSRGPDGEYGAGRLDGYAALRAAGAAISAPPTLPTHAVLEGDIAAGLYRDEHIEVVSTAFPIAATLTFPGVAVPPPPPPPPPGFPPPPQPPPPPPPNFDLELFDPNGVSVAASATDRQRHEDLSFQPSLAGTYTLRVSSPPSGFGGSYFADVSAGMPAPPVNSSPPRLYGLPADGQTLSGDPGIWSGLPAPSYALKWQRCSAPTACIDVAGATGATYALTAADVGSSLRLFVVAANSAGVGSAASAPSGAVSVAPPANTQAPSVSGIARDGGTLTVSNGSWAGSVQAFAQRWERCDSAGAGCAAIPGATGASYGLGAADVGARVRAVVTASGPGGGSAAASPASGIVQALPPASVALPVITGSPNLGSTLRASPGGWNGTTPLRFSYQWLRCGTSGGACAAIARAASGFYRPVSTDVGKRLRVRVTAANPDLPGGGTSSASSSPSAAVKAARAKRPAAVRGRVFRGTSGNDLFVGTPGPDVIRGLGGNDVLVGAGGNDRVYGGPGADRLLGGGGSDVLDGGAGKDTMLGERGNDLLLARDGSADVVDGGRGKDRARADRKLDRLKRVEKRLP